jgi:N4-gp56 family major capsid protein
MSLNYGDISPRSAGFAVAEMLKRALPYLVLEKFMQMYPLPSNSTMVALLRRYEPLALATTPLTEGVTPPGKSLTITDITATLQQYGDWVPITDIIVDFHEDKVVPEIFTLLAEQAAQTIEAVRFGVFKAGTNVYFANGSGRTDVNTAPTLAMQRKVTRGFKRVNAGYITRVTSASANYGTSAVQAAFVGLIHPDLENDVRAMTGFQNAKDYAVPGSALSEYEIGSVEDVRYIRSTVFTSWADGGGNKGAMVSSAGVKADVYPILYLAKDAIGGVPLKASKTGNQVNTPITPIVRNPGNAIQGDELGQRGFVSWKAVTVAVILQQLWMARLECAATEL